MACARAVLMAELGPSTAFIVDEQCGLLYRMGDTAHMAEEMAALLDPERADALGCNGRRVAVERRSWRAACEQLTDTLTQWVVER